LLESEESMAPLYTAANRWMRVATKPVGLEELQRVLQPDELLLEFVLDEPSSLCVATTP
jgi:hypothetical protein